MNAWGLSSDACVGDPRFLVESAERVGAEVVFLPTLSLYSPASDERRTRIYVCELRRFGYVVLSRPLWASFERVRRLAIAVAERGFKAVPSVHAQSVREIESVLSLLGGEYEAIEIDLSTSLSSSRTAFLLAAEVAKEVRDILSLEVFIKLPVFNLNYALLTQLSGGSSVRGVVFAPHIHYARGGKIYRVHSTLLSRVGCLLAESVSRFVTLPNPGIVLEEVGGSSVSGFRVLRGVSLLAEALLAKGVEKDSCRLESVSWITIPEGLGIMVSGGDLCPFGFLRGEEGYASTKECDCCGICMSLAREYKLFREMLPEAEA